MLRGAVLRFLLLCIAIQTTTQDCELDEFQKDKLYCDYIGDLATTTRTNVEVNDASRKIIFDKIPNVEKIQILYVESSITGVSNNAFENFEVLEYLELTNNQINEIQRGTFTNLTKLHKLYLHSNGIQTIEDGAFSNLPSLTIVELQGNKLKCVDGIFKNLPVKELSLNDNLLEKFEDVSSNYLPDLIFLNLSANRIKEFRAQLANLEELHLSNNMLGTITAGMFEGLPRMNHLELAANGIETLDPGTFADTTELEILDLGNNSIRDLSEKVFQQDGSNIEHLKIHNNKLQFLTLQFFMRLSQLKSVEMQGNPWKCECLKDLLEWFAMLKLEILNRKKYFDGNKAVCVIPDNEKGVCVHRYVEALTENWSVKI